MEGFLKVEAALATQYSSKEASAIEQYPVSNREEERGTEEGGTEEGEGRRRKEVRGEHIRNSIVEKHKEV